VGNLAGQKGNDIKNKEILLIQICKRLNMLVEIFGNLSRQRFKEI